MERGEPYQNRLLRIDYLACFIHMNFGAAPRLLYWHFASCLQWQVIRNPRG